ncbi:MAG: hypothetical protein AB9882_02610 [Ignavibacteriaceae bacterium]
MPKNKLEDILPKGLELQAIQFEIPKELDKVSIPGEFEVNEPTYGIEETIDVVKFAVVFGNALVKTFEDGKVTIGDLPYYFNAALKLPAALSGLNNVPKEIKDLTDEEINSLVQIVIDNTELPTAQAELVLQKSLNLVYSVYALLQAIRQ